MTLPPIFLKGLFVQSGLTGNNIRALRYLDRAKSIISHFPMTNAKLAHDIEAEIELNTP